MAKSGPNGATRCPRVRLGSPEVAPGGSPRVLLPRPGAAAGVPLSSPGAGVDLPRSRPLVGRLGRNAGRRPPGPFQPPGRGRAAAKPRETALSPALASMCCLAPRVTVRKYGFAKEQEEHEREAPRSELVVFIPEVLDPQYGMYVWPCAVVLAQYVWFHKRLVYEKRILELGAGVSLPGIVAAKCGAEIILSDNAALPQCLDNCHRSCQMNNLSGIFVTGLTWGQISPALLALPPVDIILASDVFFEPEDFEDVISTVYYLMEKNPDAQFWTTYQVRSADWSFQGLLSKWEMKSICAPLQSFGANKEQLADSDLPGRHTIEMMVITKVTM